MLTQYSRRPDERLEVEVATVGRDRDARDGSAGAAAVGVEPWLAVEHQQHVFGRRCGVSFENASTAAGVEVDHCDRAEREIGKIGQPARRVDSHVCEVTAGRRDVGPEHQRADHRIGCQVDFNQLCAPWDRPGKLRVARIDDPQTAATRTDDHALNRHRTRAGVARCISAAEREVGIRQQPAVAVYLRNRQRQRSEPAREVDEATPVWRHRHLHPAAISRRDLSESIGACCAKVRLCALA